MRICISDPRTPLPLVRIVLLATLTLLLSGWTTCSAMFAFNGCETSIAQPQVTSLSPTAIPDNTESMLLTVSGDNFVAQSRIMWNGTAMPTTLINSGTLQTTITHETLSSLGVSAGSTVQISVSSMSSTAGVAACPNEASSSLVLIIN